MPRAASALVHLPAVPIRHALCINRSIHGLSITKLDSCPEERTVNLVTLLRRRYCYFSLTMVRLLSSFAVLTVAAYVAVATPVTRQSAVFSTSCNGKSYTYNELAGYGFVPSAARDKFGDSMSLGSSIAFASWAKKGSKYEGKLYAIPDRGWNTQGTVNFQPRIHEFIVTLTLTSGATVSNPAPPNVAFVYKDTILLTGPDGNPITGLDADQTGGLTYPGFPILPAATYPGNGFGGDGPGGKRVTIDAEGLALADDGGFWLSDEYGPYLYRFDKSGKMTAAVAPPDAILPLRNGTVR